MKTVTE